MAAVPRVTVEEQSQPDLPYRHALFAVERVTGQHPQRQIVGRRPRRASLHLGVGARAAATIGTGSDARPTSHLERGRLGCMPSAEASLRRRNQ